MLMKHLLLVAENTSEQGVVVFYFCAERKIKQKLVFFVNKPENFPLRAVNNVNVSLVIRQLVHSEKIQRNVDRLFEELVRCDVINDS